MSLRVTVIGIGGGRTYTTNHMAARRIADEVQAHHGIVHVANRDRAGEYLELRRVTHDDGSEEVVVKAMVYPGQADDPTPPRWMTEVITTVVHAAGIPLQPQLHL